MAQIRLLRLFALLFSGLSVVQTFPDGAPSVSCLTMFPKHDLAEKMNTTCPFTIRVSSSTYMPSQEITVFIEGSGDNTFKGFQIRAHRVRGDTEMIMGTFTGFPDQYLKPLSCFGGMYNMLTHKDATEKKSLELTWKSPEVPVGDLVFTATILTTYSVFWADQKSSILAYTSGTVNLGNLEKMYNEDPETEFVGTCGKTKGCVLFPRHCTGDDCLAAVSFQTKNEYVHFEMMGKAEGWVSVGFSQDKFMGDDETLSCTAQDSHVTVQRGYNPALYNERQYTVGIVNMTTVQKDGYVYCRFARPIVMSLVSVNYTSVPPTPIKHTFDLSEDWYLFLGWGYTFADTDVMGKHTELPVVTGDKVSLSSTKVYRGSLMSPWLQAHGCLTVIAWMLLVGLGTVVARHYRQGIGNEITCGLKKWFLFHRLLGLLAAAFTAVSFIVAFAKIGGWTKYGDVHAYLGIAVMAATVLQVCIGLIRPSPAATIRPVFNWLHRILGKLTHAAAAAEIYFGFEISLFPEDMRQFGRVVFAVWVSTQIFWEIVMEIMAYQLENRSNLDLVLSENPEEKHLEENSRIANAVLFLYIIHITAITVAGLSAILLF